MDLTKLNQGEKVAAVSAIALILIMFVFSWFSYKPTGAGIPSVGRDAWEAFSFIDIILFVTALSALGLAYLSGTRQQLNLPVAGAAIVTGLGVLSVILIIIRMISPPDLSVSGLTFSTGVDKSLDVGVFLGLIATAALTYGAYLAMQEEGAVYGARAGRSRGSRDRGRGGPPPPSSSSGP